MKFYISNSIPVKIYLNGPNGPGRGLLPDGPGRAEKSRPVRTSTFISFPLGHINMYFIVTGIQDFGIDSKIYSNI